MKRVLYAMLLSAVAVSGCGGGEEKIPQNALARVGDEALVADELRAAMPSGLSPEDSTIFAKAYIRNWINTRLVERVAASEVDMAQIDRLTREYRDELIMSQYRRAMARQAQDGEFAEDSLRAYYEEHKDDFKLERPMVKGVYLKLPDDAPKLKQIRRLYRSDSPGDIDKLEKAAIGTAIHYDYFRDSWIDWEQIENRIPVEFSQGDAAEIARRHYLEAEAQGFVYLLCVSEFLPAGAVMPYEAARSIVRDRLLNQRRRTYDVRLLNDLYQRALDDGTLVIDSKN